MPELLSQTCCMFGDAYTTIVAWDDDIVALEKSISIADIKIFELDAKLLPIQPWGRYASSIPALMNHLLVSQSETESYAKLHCGLKQPSIFEAPKDSIPHAFWLIPRLGTRGVFARLGKRSRFLLLKAYLDETMKLGPSHCYVNKLVQRMQSWRNVVSVRSHDTAVNPIQYRHGRRVRLCHRVMCPLLKQWRKMNTGKETVDSCDAFFSGFFERVLASKPK